MALASLPAIPAMAQDASYEAILQSVYSDYMVVKTCHDIYYIDEGNLEMARDAVRAKQDYLSGIQAMDTEAIWGAADMAIGGMLQLFRMGSNQYNRGVENFCSDAFVRVTAPNNGFTPGRMKKDF